MNRIQKGDFAERNEGVLERFGDFFPDFSESFELTDRKIVATSVEETVTLVA